MRGCAIGCVSLVTPRIVILLLALLTNYFEIYQTFIWPLLGFLFMPITTIGYAIAQNEVGGGRGLVWWAIVGAAIALDLGFLGGGSWGVNGIGKRRR